MIDPTRMVVFEEPTDVYVCAERSEHSGIETVERIVAEEIHRGYLLPPDNNRAAHKARSYELGEAWVYYPKSAEGEVVDLTSVAHALEGTGELRTVDLGEPQIQCEECETMLPESEAVLETVPGATLAWCDDCCGGV